MRKIHFKTIALSLALVLAVLFAAWEPASAQQDQQQPNQPQGKTVAAGNMGVFFTNGAAANNVTVSRESPVSSGIADLKFTQPLLRVSAPNSFPRTLTYVFANVASGQTKNMSIWYKDSNSGRWRACGAFQVSDTRVACLATQLNTVFGVAETPSGLAVSGLVANTSGGATLPQTDQTVTQTVTQTVNISSTIGLGNVGIFSPAGINRNNISATKVNLGSISFSPVKFVVPLVHISAQSGNVPTAMTYVFFEVQKGYINLAEHKTSSSNDNVLNIWYRDDSGNWHQCGTTFVVNDASNESTRYACVAPAWNATYGIGYAR